jgi:hypothetical protein
VVPLIIAEFDHVMLLLLLLLWLKLFYAILGTERVEHISQCIKTLQTCQENVLSELVKLENFSSGSDKKALESAQHECTLATESINDHVDAAKYVKGKSIDYLKVQKE